MRAANTASDAMINTKMIPKSFQSIYETKPQGSSSGQGEIV